MNLIGLIVLSISALVFGGPVNYREDVEYNTAIRILEKYPLIDGHNDMIHMIRKNFRNRFREFNATDFTNYDLVGSNGITHTDIKRIKDGRLSGQFWAVYANCSTNGKDAIRLHLEQLDSLKRLFKAYSNVFQFTTSAKDIREAFNNKKFASLLGLESGHAIDSSLSMLRIYYNLGVRYMTLTHNCNTPWADTHITDQNNTLAKHNGLTDFGKKVVGEMNRLGMLVDLSHVSYKTMLDALAVSKTPVIFSHSSVYSICNHTRNVRDDVLDKLRINNGVIMINFYNGFVSCNADKATIEDVVKHFNYLKNKFNGKVDNIGIGADYDGVDKTPTDLEDVSKYPNLFAALLKEGWTESELAQVAGGNILRVLEENERYAESIKNIWPNDDLIDDSYIVEAGFKECRPSF